MGTQLLFLLSLFLVPFSGERKCHGLGGILMQCPYDLGSVLSLDLGFPACEEEGPRSPSLLVMVWQNESKIMKVPWTQCRCC